MGVDFFRVTNFLMLRILQHQLLLRFVAESNTVNNKIASAGK